MDAFLNYLSSTFALLRGMPRPARVGLFLFFAAGLADGVLVPFFALWAQKDAGIPTEYIGLLFGCYAGGELLATPFVGGIADRVGRRPVLLVSTLGVGLGFLLLYLLAWCVRGGWLAHRHRPVRERAASDRRDRDRRRGAGRQRCAPISR